MRKSVLPALFAISVIGGCASQRTANGPSPAEASISFTEFGTIYDWRADGAGGIYLQSNDHRWYHATFTSPCANLSFTEHVGLRTTPPPPANMFDSIAVRDETCYFKTFEAVSGPPSTRR